MLSLLLHFRINETKFHGEDLSERVEIDDRDYSLLVLHASASANYLITPDKYKFADNCTACYVILFLASHVARVTDCVVCKKELYVLNLIRVINNANARRKLVNERKRRDSRSRFTPRRRPFPSGQRYPREG